MAVPTRPRLGRNSALASWLRAAPLALAFGLRLWAAVCLALFVAFWLELDIAAWAGTSAAIVCQPVLGASLRKGWFRMVGTVIGAVAAVVLTACFPQSRSRLPARPCALGRRLRVRRDAVAQFRVLRRGPRRLHRGDHRGRRTRRGRRRQRRCVQSRASPVAPRSASASSARASCLPRPISAARAGGSRRCWPG